MSRRIYIEFVFFLLGLGVGSASAQNATTSTLGGVVRDDLRSR